MSKINLENYEAFALEYIEGTLSKDHIIAFNEFLEKYPNIRAEMDGFEIIKLPINNSIQFSDKSRLRKENRRLPYYWISGIAACLVILMVFNLNFSDQTSGVITDVETKKTEDNNEVIHAPKNSKSIPSENLVSSNKKLEDKSVLEPVLTQVKSYQKATIRETRTVLKDGEKEVLKNAVSNIKQTTSNQETLIESKALDVPAKSYNRPMAGITKTKNTLSIDGASDVIKSNISIATIDKSQMDLLKSNSGSRPMVKLQDTALLLPSTINNKSSLFGQLAFSNVSVSLVPSYLKKNK